ncbi:MAG: hypothetical protein ACLFVC_08425 [Opitutales bacterium]
MQLSRNTVVAILIFLLLVVAAFWIKWQLYFNLTQAAGEGMRGEMEARERAMGEENPSE